MHHNRNFTMIAMITYGATGCDKTPGSIGSMFVFGSPNGETAMTNLSQKIKQSCWVLSGHRLGSGQRFSPPFERRGVRCWSTPGVQRTDLW
jgi:hypothetical protein